MDFEFCRRQILTTKVDPHTVRVKIFPTAVTHDIGIQMNQKELIKTFMMISNWKKPLWSPSFLQKELNKELNHPFEVVSRYRNPQL